ncbi:hypothetical protein D1136_02425 [Odoribacter sp. Z80]|nr:hypothetical protein [Odoribacter sp. Z80]
MSLVRFQVLPPQNKAVTKVAAFLFVFIFLLFEPCLNQISNMNASVSVVYYKNKTLSNGEHPLMLRMTKDRKSN